MEKDRRHTVIEKIETRCDIQFTGFILNGQPSPCHLWTGPTSGTGRGGGYGRMSLNGQTVAVHLVAYTHYHGYIPGKKQVDHLCNNRLCCNPQHLELVSHLRNQKRRAQRAKEVPADRCSCQERSWYGRDHHSLCVFVGQSRPDPLKQYLTP